VPPGFNVMKVANRSVFNMLFFMKNLYSFNAVRMNKSQHRLFHLAENICGISANVKNKRVIQRRRRSLQMPEMNFLQRYRSQIRIRATVNL